MADLSKTTSREKLKARRDPYWHKLGQGWYLGFRRMAATRPGSWLARSYDAGTRKQTHKALGEFSEVPEALRFDAAKKDAEDWFKHLGRGGAALDSTVKQACERYLEHLRDEGRTRTASDAEARFKRYVYADTKLANIPLTKLLHTHLDAWRKSLRKGLALSGPRKGKARTDSALNRDMTALRAALNLARRDKLVTSDEAWLTALAPIKNADRRRDLYLTVEQRRALIVKAPEDLANLLRALCLLPVRPGALASLTVASYDKQLKTLTIGKDKAGKDRRLSLPQATAEFFASMAKDKTPAAPLLARANGSAWNKDAWKYPLKDALAAAKLPAAATAYTMRHSVITDLVTNGLDLATVAKLSGTSVAMIERHYSHLTQEHARKALAALAL